MRQFLLVIVLVGAAFGGGALVSGPGFRWAQEHLLDYMGLKDSGEIDSLELTPSPDSRARTKTVAESAEPPRAPERPAAAAAPRPDPEPRPSSPPLLPEPRVTEPFKETQTAQAAAPAPSPSPSPSPAAEPARGGGGPALLGALSSILSPAPAPAPTPTPAADPRPRAESPAPLDLGVAPSSIPNADPSPSPAPPETASADWTELRRKLAAAGVSKYEIEGDPAGRVVFSCLIPLAGKQAVSQRFEAEGDDEIQAARSVLKRINLWRASLSAAPGSP